MVKNFAKKENIPLRSILQAAHGISSGILSIARDINARMIICGWRGSVTFHRIYESPTDNVVEKSTTDVAVLMDRGLDKIDKVLVPIHGGTHCELGLRLAKEISFLTLYLIILPMRLHVQF